MDSRLARAYESLARQPGVLGATLGGGFPGSGIGSGLGRVGGGLGEPVLFIASDPLKRQMVRKDFAGDWSTPTRTGFGLPFPPELAAVLDGVGGVRESGGLGQHFDNNGALARELGGLLP
jgi:hypothetical protein